MLGQQSAFGPAGLHGTFTDAAARGLRAQAGGGAGALFAVVLGAGSVLGPLVNPRWLKVLGVRAIQLALSAG